MGALAPAAIEVGKQAAMSVAAQTIASEANKALGQTQRSGIQPTMIMPAIEKIGQPLDIKQKKPELNTQILEQNLDMAPAVDTNYKNKLDDLFRGFA